MGSRKEIQQNYMTKIQSDWFNSAIERSLSELIHCRNIFNGSFNPKLNQDPLASSKLKLAFDRLTNEHYFLETEKQNPGYL